MGFFIIFTSIMIVAHIYIGRRVITPAPISKTAKRTGWAIVLILPLLTPLSFFARLTDQTKFLSDVSGWIAFIGMGLLSLLVLFFSLHDAVFFIHKALNNSKKTYDPQRREALRFGINLGLAGAAVLITGYGFYEARRRALLEKVSIPFQNLPEDLRGIRIVQISDIHVGPTIKKTFVESVVRQVNELKADIIVFTGDMVDGTVSGLKKDVAPLQDLYAPGGVYFVTGNHEYYSGAIGWIKEMERLGFRVLLNEHDVIRYKEKSILMAGVPDYTAAGFIPEHKSNPELALKNAHATDLKILLAHQPRTIYSAEEAGYDLQISGHTHGGQYYPWNYLVTLNQPYVKGLHRHKNMWIYVNRGTGYWGPPLRLGIPSEVTEITLTTT